MVRKNTPSSNDNCSVNDLSVMSYNAQVGIETLTYKHYFTRSAKHFLPCRQRDINFEKFAEFAAQCDFVGLQEVDGGSLRSGFVNHTQYLAKLSGHKYWIDRVNRNFMGIAKHSSGLISRHRPSAVYEYGLPGIIPGRGMLVARYGGDEDGLVVAVVHLALNKMTRMRQCEFISDVLEREKNIILMGDFNCLSISDEINILVDRLSLADPIDGLKTYPSWNPKKNIDHILVSKHIEVNEAFVVDHAVSDHLPVCVKLKIPSRIHLFS